MAISEQKLKELAAIEPPKFLERIADFLADLTMRTSAVAVLERAQTEEPIGVAGRKAMSLGQAIAGKAATTRANRSVDWLYDLLKPYQIGPVELRQFSMWLVRWHDKLAETEVLRERPASGAQVTGDLARVPASPVSAATMAAGVRVGGMTAATGAPAHTGGGPVQMGQTRVRRIVRSAAGGDVVEYIEIPAEPRRTVRIARREGLAGRDESGSYQGDQASAVASREPDVLSRAWRAGHSERLPRTVGSSGTTSAVDAELAPAGTRQALTKALWVSNLAMAGVAAGYMMGRSAGAGALAARLASPVALGVAGPSATGLMQPPALSFPLSHPPVSTASWLGASPPAPEAASFVPMPGGPLASPMLPSLPSTAAVPQGAQMPMVVPVADQPPMRPADGAREAHRSAITEALSPAAAEQPVAVVMPDGSVRSLPSHPSTASPRRPSPIPGLLAAGLAGYLLGRLTSRPGGGKSGSDRWYAEPVGGATDAPRVRVYSLDRPGAFTATLVRPGSGPIETGGPFAGTAPWAGVILSGVGVGMPASRDVLLRRGSKWPSAASGGPVQLGRGLDPRLGEVTVVAPPVMVASEQAERRGAAVAFDWPVLARGAGQLDAAGLTRLRSILPPGAQAIYPALPKESLPTNAVNLRVAPSLLRPLLSQAYGSDAAGIAGSAAATASASVHSMPANVPALGRIVPARRPTGEATGVIGADTPTMVGALTEAGGGQARRTPMLDFLGMPVRLAPSLGGRAELRDELAARGVSDQGTPASAIRPHVFGPLRQQLLPGLQTVHAEPDKSAWRRAAPQFGMRDSEPTTVLAPDSRLRPVGAHSPIPPIGAASPSGLGTLSGPSRYGMLGGIDGRPYGLALPPGQGAGPSTLGAPSVGGTGDALRSGPEPDGIATDGGVRHGSWLTDSVPERGSRVRGAPIGPPLTAGGAAIGIPAGGLEEIGDRFARTDSPSGALPASQADLRRPAGVGALRFGRGTVGQDPDLASGLAQGALRVGGPVLTSPKMPSHRVPTIGYVGAMNGTPARAAQASGGLGAMIGSAMIGGAMNGEGAMNRAPTVAGLDRMGAMNRAPTVGARRWQVAGSQTMVAAPVAVGVPAPMPIPLATPIIAGVRLGPGAADEGRRVDSGRPRSVDRVGPAIGPLTVPLLSGPSIVSPVPIGIGMPVPVPVPDRADRTDGDGSGRIGDMSLPSPSLAAEAPLPHRVSSAVVTRAPERYYAAGDAGPASRRIMVQRASTGTGGVTGGPHVPSPSTQRAERAPADTQRASVLASREDGMTANEVHLLANDVWSLLRRRLALEADRRGKW